MEMGGELEDDLFYADLSKQISLLIMDDDDDDGEEYHPLVNCSSVSLQAFSHAIIQRPPAAAPLAQAQHMVLHHEHQRCRRELSKGTGVFIPQSNIPKRKQRQSRFNHNNHNLNHNNNNNNYYNNNNNSYYSKTNNKHQQQQHVVMVHDNNNNNTHVTSKFGATA